MQAGQEGRTPPEAKPICRDCRQQARHYQSNISQIQNNQMPKATHTQRPYVYSWRDQSPNKAHQTQPKTQAIYYMAPYQAHKLLHSQNKEAQSISVFGK